MYSENEIKVEKGEYTTKTGLTDCVYKNKSSIYKKTEDYKLKKSKSLLDSSDLITFE